VSLLRDVRNRIATAGLVQAEDGSSYERWRRMRMAATRELRDVPDLSAALAEYRDALHRLVTIASKARVRLTLVTQPALWRDDLPADRARLLWMGGRGRYQLQQADAYYTPAALAHALKAFNRAMLDVCAADRVDCIDLASVVSPNVDAFYDDVHLTDEGSRLAARVIADSLRAGAPFADGDQ
jgi:hypothetical protein